MSNIIPIKNKIYTIRGKQVMLDSDLAELYEVSIKRLNEQVKRNIERFPEDFMFQLTENEFEILRSQNATLDKGRGKHRKYLPYLFTEQGVASLSGVLKSKKAVEVNISIMRAFVAMRRFLQQNASVFQRITTVEQKLLEHDDKFKEIFKAINEDEVKQGIFYDGQVFDAYVFMSDLIKKAKKEIILIDNYVDETTLTLFTKRRKGVKFIIYTKNLTKQLKLDLKKHNEQYEEIIIKEFNKSHDRFLIIDWQETYLIGASLKDLGKKWFAFSKLELDILEKSFLLEF